MRATRARPDPDEERSLEPRASSSAAVPERAHAAAPAPAQVLSLQQTAGNAAVARLIGGGPVLARVGGPVVAPAGPAAVHHTQAELDAMTLSDFDAYATEQADWATEPDRPAATPEMPDAYKRRLRNLLEFAREDDGGQQPGLAGCARAELRTYARAVAQSHVTVRLGALTDVARARIYGRALAKLEVTP